MFHLLSADWIRKLDPANPKPPIESTYPANGHDIELGLEFESDPRSRTERIDVQKQRETLTLPLDRQPKALTLDPRTYVLMDADVASATSPRPGR